MTDEDMAHSTGNACKSCTSHNGPVCMLTVSPDGRWIASASSNLGILWDAHHGRPIREWLHPMDGSPTMSIAFSPDSSRLACCGHVKGRRPFVQIMPADKGSRIAVLESPFLGSGDDAPILQFACAWLSDKLIFVCLAPSTIFVRTWNAQTFEPLSSWEDATSIDHGSLLFSCDGRWLAVVAVHGPLEAYRTRSGTTAVPLCVLWDLDSDTPMGGPPTREVLSARSSQDDVLAASFDPEGERLVLSFADHTIRIWSVGTRETLLSVAEPTPLEFEPRYHLYRAISGADAYTKKAVAFSPDGRYLLSLRFISIEERVETLVILWDSLSGRPLLRWDDTQPSEVCRNSGLVGFSPSGTHVAFTANGGRVHVVDLSRGTHISRQPELGLRSMRHDATSIAFSPDGQTLCWGTRGGDVEISSF